jgi:membrane protein implicated in regulation of membrane protease activity
MEIWHVWLIVGILFVIVEIFTQGFAVICFTFGCVAAAICAALDTEFLYQMIAFGALSLLAFVLVRPVILKYFAKSAKDTKTNTDALIGRRVFVSETIDPENRTGYVTVDGEEWKAISDTNEIIEKGTMVEIIDRNSIILTIKKI